MLHKARTAKAEATEIVEPDTHPPHCGDRSPAVWEAVDKMEDRLAALKKTNGAASEPAIADIKVEKITTSAKFSPSRDQIRTEACSCSWYMLQKSFARGVEDVRTSRPARFDAYAANTNDLWAYEKGRQFAILVPKSLPLTLSGKLNPKALRLFKAAVDRGDIAP